MEVFASKKTNAFVKKQIDGHPILLHVNDINMQLCYECETRTLTAALGSILDSFGTKSLRWRVLKWA